jgi:flagellar hook-length control protein FliK
MAGTASVAGVPADPADPAAVPATTPVASTPVVGTNVGKKIASLDQKAVQDGLQAALAALASGQGTAAMPATTAATTTASTGTATAGSADATGLGAGGAGAGKGLSAGATLADAKGGLADSVKSTVANAAVAATPDALVGRSAGEALAAANAGSAQDSFATQKDTADSAQAALAATQAASVSAASNAVSPTTNNPNAIAAASTALTPQIGTPDWDEALSQKVVFLSNAHQQTAELTLNPKDLGPLQVVLQVADNHAHALFVSQHQQVREAVEAALPKLREAMEQGGIGLGSASVSDGFARQTAQQGQDGSSSSSSSSRGGRNGRGGDSAGSDGAVSVANVPVRRTVGLVDTFA